MKTAIDLGHSYDGPCCPEPCVVDKQKKHYPCLYLDCGSELLDNLPKEGELTVRYKVTSKTTSERDGKKSCNLTLEVHEITEVEKEKEEDNSAEASLDRLAKLETAKG